jgi:hypothetical protein
MVVVRFLLFLSLSAILVSAGLYLYTRDRKYLRFIGQVMKFSLLLLLAILAYFLFERLVLVA